MTYTSFIVATLLLISRIGFAQPSSAMLTIIPQPVQAVSLPGQPFIISSSTDIRTSDTSLAIHARLLDSYIGRAALLPHQKSQKTNFITLTIDSLANPLKESYQVKVSDSNVTISGHDAAGVLYGVQTLRQLWTPAKCGSLSVSPIEVTDYPRFGYRGMHLDVSRHFFGTAFIKKFIDLIALYKFNAFHWHLTDDQGWRIEIRKYPLLQTVAAFRSETLKGHKKELPHVYDGRRYGGYYTRQQVKEIVSYASERNVNVIPEIEMPGHAVAALAAYPGLGCTGGPYHTATLWGIFDDVFCAGKDSTFIFLEDVLDEVMDMFPSKYIHIGGDECPKSRWKHCPYCQRRIQKEGLSGEEDLQAYFVKRIADYLTEKGRKIIGWDEVMDGNIGAGVTAMCWRGNEANQEAIKQQRPMILAPEDHLYFDYYQSLYAGEPLAAGNYTSLREVYGYEPMEDSVLHSNAQLVEGIQGEAWSEYYNSSRYAEYMIFPRAVALAEVAWSPRASRDYRDFLRRLRLQERMLQKLQVNYASNFDEINCSVSVKPNAVVATLFSSSDGPEIRYTTSRDRSAVRGKRYERGVLINRSCTLTAALVSGSKRVGREFRQQFHLHKAVGSNVVLAHPPVDRFNPGSGALVNAMFGSSRYHDGQWMGFSGSDFDAVIDLGEIKPVSTIAINLLVYHWQKMWAPDDLKFYISADSITFHQVFEKKKFGVNGINRVICRFIPSEARYVRVVGIARKIIPAGSYGAGGKPLLLVDEVIIN